MGVSKYDNGERFDPRVLYAEQEYEDVDAEVAKRVGDAFGVLGACLVGNKGMRGVEERSGVEEDHTDRSE